MCRTVLSVSDFLQLKLRSAVVVRQVGSSWITEDKHLAVEAARCCSLNFGRDRELLFVLALGLLCSTDCGSGAEEWKTRPGVLSVFQLNIHIVLLAEILKSNNKVSFMFAS